MMKIYLLTPLRKKKPKGNLKTRIANKLGIDLLNKPWTNTFQDNSCWNLRSGSLVPLKTTAITSPMSRDTIAFWLLSSFGRAEVAGAQRHHIG